MRERMFLQIEQKVINKQDVRRKVAVMQALKNNMKLMRDERQIEEEHNTRKAQIDNFFSNLRKKVEKENTEKSAEKDKEKLKERVRQHHHRYA